MLKTGQSPPVPEAGCAGYEAHLIEMACTPSPAGHDHWTLRLLARKVVEWGWRRPIPRDDAAAPEKNVLKPWEKQEWCIPQVSGTS